MSVNAPVPPGRTCGTCTLCCKIYEVPPIDNKPKGVWCKHCTPGKGCGIWETRPAFCRDFHCQWILDVSLGPEWRPDTAKFVMNIQQGNTLAVAVDPGQKNAWKREPYYAAFKKMVPEVFMKGLMIVIMDSSHKILVTPHSDIIVGRHDEAMELELKQERTAIGTRWVALKDGRELGA
ncbi:MAG: hypothetical protein ACRC7C_09960 [Beijerinckiaceae bacterium]